MIDALALPTLSWEIRRIKKALDTGGCLLPGRATSSDLVTNRGASAGGPGTPSARTWPSRPEGRVP
jgi:hypothetical protein